MTRKTRALLENKVAGKSRQGASAGLSDELIGQIDVVFAARINRSGEVKADITPLEEQFHEAVFTHASTSPNLQIIASIDVARRQMELEGYELVNRAIQLALDLRREVNTHPLISKYFRILGADELIPERIQELGLCGLFGAGCELGEHREGVP